MATQLIADRLLATIRERKVELQIRTVYYPAPMKTVHLFLEMFRRHYMSINEALALTSNNPFAEARMCIHEGAWALRRPFIFIY